MVYELSVECPIMDGKEGADVPIRYSAEVVVVEVHGWIIWCCCFGSEGTRKFVRDRRLLLLRTEHPFR